MNTLNLILSNLHWYILASSVLVYAIVHLVESRAKGNPAQTWEDDWLPTLHTLSELGAKGVDLLAAVLASRGDLRLKDGKAKLEELQTKIAEWETLWRQGRKKEVILQAWAWYVDLRGKAARIPAPFVPAAIPAPGNGPAGITNPPAAGPTIGPDDEAR